MIDVLDGYFDKTCHVRNCSITHILQISGKHDPISLILYSQSYLLAFNILTRRVKSPISCLLTMEYKTEFFHHKNIKEPADGIFIVWAHIYRGKITSFNYKEPLHIFLPHTFLFSSLIFRHLHTVPKSKYIMYNGQT